jgi:hypothetical protein
MKGTCASVIVDKPAHLVASSRLLIRPMQLRITLQFSLKDASEHSLHTLLGTGRTISQESPPLAALFNSITAQLMFLARSVKNT